MNKDWTGNRKTAFAQLGASNHSETGREANDFYATDPNSLRIFLEALERDDIKLHGNIWECACGQGHLSKVLTEAGYQVKSSDIIDRGYGEVIDFLKCGAIFAGGDILTNPPYKYAKQFVWHSLDLLTDGCWSVMFLKIQFLESRDRRELFDRYPPKYIYINSDRQTCYINGDMSQKMSSATCYCWYMWEKGFKGEPTVRWI